ncbi:MAG: hypothetical protein AAB618_01835 [Patescibacteria group bacterium]
MILALFTAGVVSTAAVPETAYGHIAMTKGETSMAALESAKLTVAVKTSAPARKTYTTTKAYSTPGASAETESIVRSYFSDIPVMIEIARCESGFRHTLSDGSTLSGRVDSADTGVMQINRRYHQATANAMDLNLDTISGNMAYARHLYEEQGVQPWRSSSSCWNRTLAANI